MILLFIYLFVFLLNTWAAVLVCIRDIFKKKILNLNYSTLLTGSVWIPWNFLNLFFSVVHREYYTWCGWNKWLFKGEARDELWRSNLSISTASVKTHRISETATKSILDCYRTENKQNKKNQIIPKLLSRVLIWPLIPASSLLRERSMFGLPLRTRSRAPCPSLNRSTDVGTILIDTQKVTAGHIHDDRSLAIGENVYAELIFNRGRFIIVNENF